MPFRVPAVTFDPRHLSPADVPSCTIILHIRCDDGDCQAAEMQARVTDDAGILIAEGHVTCTGGSKKHELDVVSRQMPLQQVHVHVGFVCGEKEDESRAGRIFVQCS